MSIEQLLGEIPKQVFAEDYYLKLPFSLAGGCRSLVSLGSWDTVEQILAQSDVDVLVVRQGERWEGKAAPSYPVARELFAQGYTLVIRHAERHHPQIAQLAEGFRRDFSAEVDVHLYCTPADQFGFGWHYDAEDVFILQTAGVKEYLLRKNTVNPWPLVETIPADMRYEREIMPLVRCSLHGGDWLYIPAGYWHRAESRQEAISLAVGVMSSSAVELFDFVRPQVLSSLLWRQRLPTAGEASSLSTEELIERYRELCGELARDLTRMLTSPALVEDFLKSKGRLPQPAAGDDLQPSSKPPEQW